ncbi:MAG: cob(I)yrinic acid a,c-diamide adenosyltransferase [Candidatus Omnitrophica bacterium]|nr:cob(I)yrinic acid a,c-diamide adenosyltransferase [Candidatus Omnitrophota bacterium]
MLKEKGLIQIYTGDGKGKTTQAVGQAVRAAGQGLKVCFIHFFKDPQRFPYGEDRILRKIGIRVFHFAPRHPHFYSYSDKKEISKTCRKACADIKKIFRKKFDMIVLDEINIALRDGFLKEKEILTLLKTKPAKTHLILTGRGASKNLIKKADLASEIRKIKHPFDKGIKARKAIEY